MIERPDPRAPELLAPAGGMRALAAVLEAGADAVYVSGKRFGMRAHRASLHFDDDALAQAVRETERAGARLYVTVNNLLADAEIDAAVDYVRFLDGVGVAAIIAQDLGLLARLAESPPRLERHASTMLNVHSSGFATFLGELGVNRIVTSRDITLHQAAEMARRSGLEMEYFVHGDMCSVQGSLCHLSTVLFGQSANRGRCLKPCRWTWRVAHQGNDRAAALPSHLLARKDQCLLHALPEVIEAGIASLKIEGRMRPAEFLASVVGAYREAIDSYRADPFSYREPADSARRLFRERVRDFGSTHAFGARGAESMGLSGAREPHAFSAPIPVLPLDPARPAPENAPAYPLDHPPELSVAVSDPAVLDSVLGAGADWVHLTIHLAGREPAWSVEAVGAAVQKIRDAGARAAVTLPPVTPDGELDHLAAFARAVTPAPDAWVAGNAGQLAVLAAVGNAACMAGPLFNVFNAAALDLLAARGVTRVILSPEISVAHLSAFRRPHPVATEYAVHGRVQAMFTEDCLLRVAFDPSYDPGSCRHFCASGPFVLEDEAGERYPIAVTNRCRNAIFLDRHLCLLPRLPSILAAGARALRLDLGGYAAADAACVVRIYRGALDRLERGEADWLHRPDLHALEACSGAGLFEGAASHGVMPFRDAATGEDDS